MIFSALWAISLNASKIEWTVVLEKISVREKNPNENLLNYTDIITNMPDNNNLYFKILGHLEFYLQETFCRELKCEFTQ